MFTGERGTGLTIKKDHVWTGDEWSARQRRWVLMQAGETMW